MKSYLRDQAAQIELVLLTALTAVAWMVIVLPPGTEKEVPQMAWFGLIVVGLAVACWLVRQVGQVAIDRWMPMLLSRAGD